MELNNLGKGDLKKVEENLEMTASHLGKKLHLLQDMGKIDNIILKKVNDLQGLLKKEGDSQNIKDVEIKLKDTV